MGVFGPRIGAPATVGEMALGLTLLARRIPRLKAGQVAGRLLRISDSVLDVARHLAVSVSVIAVQLGEVGVTVTNLGSEDI
jgi:hypothetical protein